MANSIDFAQNYVTCALCTSTVCFYCSPCHFSLCVSCVGRHLMTKTIDEHKIIKYCDKSPTLKTVPEILESINCGYETSLFDLALAGENTFYVCSQYNSNIKMIGSKGDILTSIDMKSEPIRLASTPDSVIYSDREHNAVMTVKVKDCYRPFGLGKRKKTKVLFLTGEWIPGGIILAHSGDLVVALWNKKKVDASRGKVVKYSLSGQVLLEIIDHNASDLYRKPRYVAENRNGDICVSDEYKKELITVDRNGIFRFSYVGQQNDKYTFIPSGLACDSHGHIIVADFMNDKMHVLDSDGYFLKCLASKDLGSISGLRIDNNDHIFACDCSKGHVKVMKYIS